MKSITYKETLDLKSTAYIDVRSPGEFNEATIPGAINLPIFDNQERAQVGTVYTQQSPAKARILGIEIVAPKLPDLVKKIQKLSKKYENLILFCARGGMRSESIGLVAKMAGFELYKLKGGYKAYRHFILDQLEEYKLDSKLLVIHGYTGVGKTKLLYQLQNLGIPIIDLEGLANHRGSAFSSIGLGEPTNQKQFDSLLWEKLNKINGVPIIAVESESKRVGISVIPDFFKEAMEEGIHILIDRSIDSRIDEIFSEYSETYNQNKKSFINRSLESISAIKKHLVKKIGKAGYQQLIKECKQGQFDDVIKTLLIKYYDPLYQHSLNKYQDKFTLKIKQDNLNQISQQITTFIDNSIN
ncbi:tRNA 2-selenouridine synthase [Halobacteroides halobius DSM 5150]|uniref:tRNA 2-selenouridine synthase n=1 Tax=Halobacteroides halobius (strain ATCC 35273 / DSM 5150 / MD-1) TaxID=748449 RepID=L0K8Q7_HALHC|nr:tRNA 2-selenouridine(34) synthase MnmH [Halobacteroides halobius]AGB41386.1 tRNA 2-selenouridine synthase [Halobacteroides halobius DSM 5150]